MFYYSYRGVCVVVRPQPSKLETRVRFPHAAPISQLQGLWTDVQVTVSKRLTFWNRRFSVIAWVRSPVYFYKKNQPFYFSRSVPSDLRHRFNKKKIEVSLRTKSEVKAAKSAALSDRLERYWDNLRMEQIHLKELGLFFVNQSAAHGPRFYDGLAKSIGQ